MSKKIYKLHVVERGKGRPVILLHGVLSTHRYWSEVAALVESKRRLLLPDLLGFGASPKPRRAQYSLKQFVDCLEHTFEAYDFAEKPVLAGHSMGASIALRWAVEQPDKFRGLVLSAPLLFEKSRFHQQMASLPLDGKWLDNKTLAKLITYAIGLAGVVPVGVAVRFANGRPRYVMEDVTRPKLYVFRKLLRNVYYHEDVLAELRQLRIPTRILIGDQDWITIHSLKKLEKLCQESPFCQLEMVKGSHQILLEHPKTVARAIVSLS
jgi:pimeloyl-ACP methyl ester carboxylesterase